MVVLTMIEILVLRVKTKRLLHQFRAAFNFRKFSILRRHCMPVNGAAVYLKRDLYGMNLLLFVCSSRMFSHFIYVERSNKLSQNVES